MFRQHAVQSEAQTVRCGATQLTIRSQRDGDLHVLALVGELDVHSAEAFEDELKRVEGTDAAAIVVDLGALTSIGADGLKVFIHAGARSRANGNRLMLLAGPDRVQKTFERTGLLSRLPFVSVRDTSTLVHSQPPRVHLLLSTPVHGWGRS